MLGDFATELQSVIASMKVHMVFSLKLIIALWVIHVINSMTHYKLNVFGIKTRNLPGLIGILFSPFLHANYGHLFFNTIPLFVLSDLVLLEGTGVFCAVSLTIILLSGFLTWLFGQKGIHIGASSLIMGYFGFLLSKAYFDITASSFILAAVCLYYFGGLALSIFPSAKKNISWDGHLFGLLSGIFAAYYLKVILEITGF